MRTLRRTIATVLLAAVAAAGFGTPAAAGPSPVARGRLVAAHPVTTYQSRDQVAAFLAANHFDATIARYGVSLHQLIYRTVDPNGRPTTASGLLVLPLDGSSHLRTVSFGHGTSVYRGDAPSLGTDPFLTGPAISFASAGFAAVAPDYLGLGAGTGPHPWMDVPTETSASLDLLRAARTFTAGQGRELDREVYASGFSQGASAALGLARALRSGADPWFRAAAIAPISGGYALRRVEIPAALDPASGVVPRLAAAYLAYLLTSYDRWHDIYPDPAVVFTADYVSIGDLFDAGHPGAQVLAGVPESPALLLTPAGRDLLSHPRGRFAAALREADSVCEWTPGVPVRLYFSPGDEQAVTGNTTACRGSFAAHGVRVPVVDAGVDTSYDGMVHEGSELLAVPMITRWFAGLAGMSL
ncbi:Lipase 4 [Actinoplanes sp. SE50]|uniref:alpha/beta hydrolase n=1 Tax=unclassified Actinoplanes TaxID=2626549 RepID=UPI00023ECD7A|nr:MULTISPECIES: alpha/beta hydrolase [unclassified Actinoplanes]AEV87195.1 Lipase 4 [Actinoplanes sp. SE50/110]ATO85596.1 Lipase 4 [Actinoplanes sp. SE50]SLM03009.1 lipase [Actinoplanes sp. SE50/110]